MFFNIFINDLFQHVKYAKLNAYADDHQIYSSSLDPLALEECICQEVNVANQWYKNNGMIVNEKKHQALCTYQCKSRGGGGGVRARDGDLMP